jgi:hypothetical protein
MADDGKTKADSSDQSAVAPAKPKESNFRRFTDIFIRRIEAIGETFPLAMSTMTTEGKAVEATLAGFLNTHGTKTETDGKVTFVLDSSRLGEYHRLAARSTNVKIALDVLPRSFVVLLISEFDAFIGVLIRLFYKAKPEALEASERTFTLADLKEFRTIGGARDFAVEKETEAVLRKSHTETFEWLEKHLKIPLRDNLNIWSHFIELTERRNLFVHTDGVITRQYLDVCAKAGHKCPDKRGEAREPLRLWRSSPPPRDSPWRKSFKPLDHGFDTASQPTSFVVAH